MISDSLSIIAARFVYGQVNGINLGSRGGMRGLPAFKMWVKWTGPQLDARRDVYSYSGTAFYSTQYPGLD